MDGDQRHLVAILFLQSDLAGVAESIAARPQTRVVLDEDLAHGRLLHDDHLALGHALAALVLGIIDFDDLDLHRIDTLLVARLHGKLVGELSTHLLDRCIQRHGLLVVHLAIDAYHIFEGLQPVLARGAQRHGHLVRAVLLQDHVVETVVHLHHVVLEVFAAHQQLDGQDTIVGAVPPGGTGTISSEKRAISADDVFIIVVQDNWRLVVAVVNLGHAEAVAHIDILVADGIRLVQAYLVDVVVGIILRSVHQVGLIDILHIDVAVAHVLSRGKFGGDPNLHIVDILDVGEDKLDTLDGLALAHVEGIVGRNLDAASIDGCATKSIFQQVIGLVGSILSVEVAPPHLVALEVDVCLLYRWRLEAIERVALVVDLLYAIRCRHHLLDALHLLYVLRIELGRGSTEQERRAK